MKTNLEKWNHYKTLLDHRANEFMDSINPLIPKVFYTINEFRGTVDECTVLNRHYNYEGLWYEGKRPNKAAVIRAIELYESESVFTTKRAFFDYSYNWGEGTAKTAINIIDMFGGKKAFLKKEIAEMAAMAAKKIYDDNKAFDVLHKKDASYNYSSNGYKFLGWQNGGLTNRDLYDNCIAQKHRKIEVQHTRSGSENTVSCPVCKIYWKYDCSD